ADRATPVVKRRSSFTMAAHSVWTSDIHRMGRHLLPGKPPGVAYSRELFILARISVAAAAAHHDPDPVALLEHGFGDAGQPLLASLLALQDERAQRAVAAPEHPLRPPLVVV